MIFSFVSALADIEMNLTVRCSEAAKIPRKKKKKKKKRRGKCWSGLRREGEIILGLGSGEVAFNFVLISDF